MARSSELLERTAESFFNGIHIAPDTDKPISPEQRLWMCCVARAWHDAFVASDSYILNTDRNVDPCAVRGEARRWLVADYGDYAFDRGWACDLAGISPEFVQSAARRKLSEVKMAEAESRTAEVQAIDRAFSELLDDEDAFDAVTLDDLLASLASRERELV